MLAGAMTSLTRARPNVKFVIYRPTELIIILDREMSSGDGCYLDIVSRSHPRAAQVEKSDYKYRKRGKKIGNHHIS
jgi:hypothetical protein